ncbi:hypothetical protein C2845_PM12G19880 [Panicum miliaceum]|uniref:Uncharacterized protein n=1 Tax=Panicum miliaceum TaxID=4540 RepID=A0A3L6QEH6_PANMI|nr:hypothetical protein C2845_PM12G19880 [Panicum miliaceum]
MFLYGAAMNRGGTRGLSTSRRGRYYRRTYYYGCACSGTASSPRRPSCPPPPPRARSPPTSTSSRWTSRPCRASSPRRESRWGSRSGRSRTHRRRTRRPWVTLLLPRTAATAPSNLRGQLELDVSSSPPCTLTECMIKCWNLLLPSFRKYKVYILFINTWLNYIAMLLCWLQLVFMSSSDNTWTTSPID